SIQIVPNFWFRSFLIPLIVLAGLPAASSAQQFEPSKIENNNLWKTKKLVELTTRLESPDLSDSDVIECRAQIQWLQNWDPETGLSSLGWHLPTQTKQTEPLLDSPSAQALRRKLEGLKDNPMTEGNDKPLIQWIQSKMEARTLDLTTLQTAFHWVDDIQRRKQHLTLLDHLSRSYIEKIEKSQVGSKQRHLLLQFAWYRRARALAYQELPDVVAKNPIQDPAELDRKIRESYKQLKNYAGEGRPEFILLDIRMLRRNEKFGSAIVLLEQFQSSILRKWYLKKRRDLLEKLDWQPPFKDAVEQFKNEFPNLDI
ncbi:MAG: hypothetical protein AAF939_22925, partial [Planctomycetota bacterium]